MSNPQTNDLIQLFAENYFENLYYFALKKVSNANEASDLAADIALNVIHQLRKGTVPDNFSAWVWKIARNRYSAWAKNKSKSTNALSGSDIGALEIPADCNVASDIIHQEDLQLLRRELAFISSEYRNILVAYYIEYKSIKDIAESQNLPIGTVKSKLSRSRKKLKEGMDMAREFGTLSYKPEDIYFISNGFPGANGEPWSHTNKKLCKNIMLAAYRTPSTAEELAMEIGMSLPYMEDELETLVQGELLRKNGKKYETNLIIISAAAQKKVFANLDAIKQSLTEKLIALVEGKTQMLAENNFQWHEGYQPYEDMKWAMLMVAIDNVRQMVVNNIHNHNNASYNWNMGKYGHTIRPNGGEWDLLGMEMFNDNRPITIGCHGSATGRPAYEEQIEFAQFKFWYRDIAYKTPEHLTHQHTQAFVAVAKHNIEGINPQILSELVEYGYLEKIAVDEYRPTFLITFREKIGDFTPPQREKYDKLFGDVYDIAFEHYNFCREVLSREIPDFIKDNLGQINHAYANIFEMRGTVLAGALENGYITYADNDDRKMLGAVLMI